MWIVGLSHSDKEGNGDKKAQNSQNSFRFLVSFVPFCGYSLQRFPGKQPWCMIRPTQFQEITVEGV